MSNVADALSSAAASSPEVSEATTAASTASSSAPSTESSQSVSVSSTVVAAVTHTSPVILETVLSALPQLYLDAVRRWIENDLPVLYKVHTLMLEYTPGREAEIAAKIRLDTNLQSDLERAYNRINRLYVRGAVTSHDDPNRRVVELVYDFFSDARSCKEFVDRILSSVERLA